MLLVLVALSVGVVLAGVALTSRQPGTRIGQNACDDAAARWGAHAAAGYAQAVLETAANCVDYSNTKSGDFIQSFDVQGGMANVRLTRLDGSTPQPGDRELIMTAVATVGSMTATVEKRVSLANPIPMSVAADSRLGEFAIFAGTGITIEQDTVIARSPFVSEADSLNPVKIGTGFASASALAVDKDADMRHTSLFIDGHASTSLDPFLTSTRYFDGKRLPYSIPLIRETSRPEIASLPLLSLVLGLLNGVTQTLTGGNYSTLDVRNSAVVTLGQAGQKTVYKFGSLNIQDSGVLRFAGEVIVQVSGATTVQRLGAIEPAAADSKIELYLGRNVTIDDCAIGLPRAIARNTNRLPKDVGAHPLASQVYLSTLNTANGGSASPVWSINSRAVVLASIHAPQSSVTIDGKSTLIGRVTCGTFTMRNQCNLYYDPRLDCRAGYTELDGPLYVDRLPISQVSTYLSSVASSAGAQSLQDGLKTTLDAVWTAAVDRNVLVKPATMVAIEAEDIGVAGAVVVETTGTPDVRIRGKAKCCTMPQRAEGYED